MCTCCPAGSPSTQLPRDDAPSAWTMTPNPCGVQPTRSCQRMPGHSLCMFDSILDMTRCYHACAYLVCTGHDYTTDVRVCQHMCQDECPFNRDQAGYVYITTSRDRCQHTYPRMASLVCLPTVHAHSTSSLPSWSPDGVTHTHTLPQRP